MSDPVSDRDKLAGISDPTFPNSDIAQPRTAKEVKKYERDSQKLTPADRHDIACQRHIEDLRNQVERHVDGYAKLRTELDSSRAENTIALVELAALKVSHLNLQAAGSLSSFMIIVAGVGASIGSYFIPNWLGYIIMIASLLTLVWGLILQNRANAQSRQVN